MKLQELPFYSERRGVFCVSASAGAGKTYRLALYYLRLLKQEGPPSEEALSGIVALTFTNQAAAEMRERILIFLKHIALRTEFGRKLSLETGLLPEEAAEWLKVIFENYHAFQVRTIDSLIFTLVKGLAFELGLRPELSAELKEDLFVSEAFDRLLLRLREDPSVREAFERALLTFLEVERRGGFNPEFHFKRRLKEIYKLAARKGLKGEAEVVSREELAEMERWLREAGERLVELLEEAGGEFAYPSWRKALLDPVENFYSSAFKKDSPVKLFKKRARPRELPSQAEVLYEDLKRGLERYLFLKARAEVHPYEEIFVRLNEELSGMREEEGVLQAGTWTELLLNFLSDGVSPLVYLKLSSRIKHILLDEFQDTNRIQWSALEPLVREVLSEGGTLFLVADVKQAIYMWRGGDPELFFEVPKRLPAILHHERILKNFRSARGLVKFNNDFFERLLSDVNGVVKKFLYGKDERRHPEYCPVVEELSERLRTAFSDHAQAWVREEAGEVRVVELELEAENELFKQQVLERIEEVIREEGDFSGIAILTRENREAEEVASFLLERGIPAVTEKALKLESSPLIKGMISLFKFLDYTEDETALVGFLTSPLLEGGDEVVRGFLHSPERSFIEYVEKEAPWIPSLLEALSRVLEGSNLYALVQEVVRRFRLFERFPSERPYVERFLSAVLRYEEEVNGLSGFLELWNERGVEEKIGLPRELNAVKVFTIHASKGLEFPTVIIPFLTWRPRGRSELVVTEEGLLRIRSGGPRRLEEIKLKEKGREVVETLNLLYVAFTRARERLVLFLPKETRYYTVGSLVREVLSKSAT